MASKIQTYSFRSLGSVHPEDGYSFQEEDSLEYMRYELGNPRKCKEGITYDKSSNTPFSFFAFLRPFGLFRRDVWRLNIKPPGGSKKALVEISPNGSTLSLRFLHDAFRAADVAKDYMEAKLGENPEEADSLLANQYRRQKDKKAKPLLCESIGFFAWLEGEHGMQLLYEVKLAQKAGK